MAAGISGKSTTGALAVPDQHNPPPGYAAPIVCEGILDMRDVMVPMRDGKHLCVDIYRPNIDGLAESFAPRDRLGPLEAMAALASADARRAEAGRVRQDRRIQDRDPIDRQSVQSRPPYLPRYCQPRSAERTCRRAQCRICAVSHLAAARRWYIKSITTSSTQVIWYK